MRKLQGIFLILLMCLGGTVFADDQVTVLVTGANRGIGLEYAKQLSAKGYTVIGTARNPDDADELDVVADRVEQLDVADPQSVAALARRLEGVAIDILINNAGIFPRQDVTIDTVDYDMMEKVLAVNTLGPLRVTQALLPNLRADDHQHVLAVGQH